MNGEAHLGYNGFCESYVGGLAWLEFIFVGVLMELLLSTWDRLVGCFRCWVMLLFWWFDLVVCICGDCVVVT